MTIVEVWGRSVVLVRDDQIVAELEMPGGDFEVVMRMNVLDGVTDFYLKGVEDEKAQQGRR